MKRKHYSHYRAGVTALLAALTDEEGSVRLSQQKVLSLCAVQVPNKPTLLIVVWQVLILFTHKVSAAPNNRQNRVVTASSTKYLTLPVQEVLLLFSEQAAEHTPVK